MHIYAFGSICRGDVSPGSDVDVLAIVEGRDARFDPATYSIYSYSRIGELWQDGNPFAWHLSLESRLLFASDHRDYIKELGGPRPYTHCLRDCVKFHDLFRDAYAAVVAGSNSAVFELSTIFLSIRNIATCFSLGITAKPDFSRHSALRLEGNELHMSRNSYRILERSRILCTRGHGARITAEEIAAVVESLHNVDEWMSGLVRKVRTNE